MINKPETLLTSHVQLAKASFLDQYV